MQEFSGSVYAYVRFSIWFRVCAGTDICFERWFSPFASEGSVFSCLCSEHVGMSGSRSTYEAASSPGLQRTTSRPARYSTPVHGRRLRRRRLHWDFPAGKGSLWPTHTINFDFGCGADMWPGEWSQSCEKTARKVSTPGSSTWIGLHMYSCHLNWFGFPLQTFVISFHRVTTMSLLKPEVPRARIHSQKGKVRFVSDSKLRWFQHYAPGCHPGTGAMFVGTQKKLPKKERGKKKKGENYIISDLIKSSLIEDRMGDK